MKKFIFSLVAGVASITLSAQTPNPQAWDFGAEQLSGYDNMLNETEINSWFTAEPGTANVTVSDITASEGVNFIFNGGGKTNHRLRTTNSALTRYDNKSLKDANNNEYKGYIYSNVGSNPNVYIQQNYQVNDKVEFFVGSNGGTETYELSSPSGKKTQGNFTNAAKIEKLTFYIGETGAHKFYGLDEKLVVARIIRTPATPATLSGTISAPGDIPTDYKLVFTNLSNGVEVEVTPSEDNYSAALAVGFSYKVSLKNANEYVIASTNPIEITAAEQNADISINKVDISTISGTITGLPAHLFDVLAFRYDMPEGAVFVPELTFTPNSTDTTYTLRVETGIQYTMHALNVNDYNFSESILYAESDISDYAVTFSLKPTYAITIAPTVATHTDLAGATFTFTNLNEEGYVYTFTGTENIKLRDGVYSVKVTNSGAFKQLLTSNLKVEGAAVTKVIDFEKPTNETLEYKATITVGADKDFATINEALAAIRKMTRPAKERVVVMIDPGNYEEMLAVDVANVSFVNASPTPSIAIKDAGVNIDENAVRITAYYGHGYNYFSMNSKSFWDARTLAVNKENGYTDMVNGGGSSSTYWNASVIVSAVGFEATNIIFENSFNQYISKRESEDVLVKIDGQHKGDRPTTVGSTAVQARSYRERAAALAFTKTSDRAFLNNCRIIGRQDALYGDQGARVACYKGVFMGACDYIFGGMTLVCYQTELAMNTTEDNNDVTYITAAKNTSGRGYLFYQCHITSAKPEVEMVTTVGAKPGLFGRPWDANGEAVFFKTEIDATTCPSFSGSLIQPAGWNNGLVSSGSPRSVEFGTIEAAGVDNSAQRVSWAAVLTEPKLKDDTEISCFNFTKGTDNWDPLTELMEDENGILTPKSTELGIKLSACNGRLFVKNVPMTTTLNVFLPDGRMLHTSQLNGDANIALASGMYIVRMTNEKGSAVQKVLVK